MAVALVLAYHGGVVWVGGGFLGVDVFLVLSGYLITAILVAEWEERGGIDVLAFWGRRVRRLLPALLAVLVVVAALAPHLIPADQLGAVRDDGLAALFHVGNWRQVLAGHGYFDQFGHPSPFLHLWSLGVEEQWYLLWPLVLVAGLCVVPRARRLLPWVVAAAAGSAGLMALLASSSGDISRPFYGTDTRAQALLVGAALALALAPWSAARFHRSEATGGGPVGILGLLGAAVLAAMVVGAGEGSLWLYRGGSAVVALAAAALIAAAVQPTGVVRRVLSIRPLRAAGRISYGLYLWHWPVYLALTPARTGLGGAALLGVRVAATVAIAACSYRFLEMPIRRGALPRLRAPVVAITAGAAIVALLVVPTRGARPVMEPVSSVAPVEPVAALTPRAAADPERVRVLLAGDSVALSLGWHFKAEVVGGGGVRTAAVLGCGVARGRPIENGALSVNPRCEQWPAEWARAARSTDADVAVVMVGAWEVFDREVGNRVLRVGTAEYRRYLLDELETGFGIVAARGVPVALLGVPCYNQLNFEVGKAPSERNDPARVTWVNQVLAEFAGRHTGRVTSVDLGGFLCPDGRYVERLGDVKMRWDGVHFTPEGARATWQWLWPQLRAIATQG